LTDVSQCIAGAIIWVKVIKENDGTDKAFQTANKYDMLGNIAKTRRSHSALKEWRIANNVSKSTAMLFSRRRIQNPRLVQLLGEPIVWVDAARYLGVILDTRLTWSSHIDHVRKKAAQRLEVLGPLLHRRSGLSIRNGVLLYKQIIRPMMDYGCPVWRSAARSHISKLQVIQPKCLRAATGASW
jgi:hypothetical protein